MAKKNEIIVKEFVVKTIKHGNVDYICMTDIARMKNAIDPNGVVANWMRNRNTIEFLGIWETLYNPNFNPLEFEGIRAEAGLNAFTMSPTRWIELTNAIGIISQAGRYGGTYACSDIAFEFASWVSVEFRLYLVKEFQRLKEEEQKVLGWSAKRELAKINYHIHTDAIKENLIPQEIDAYHRSLIYAEEADVLNVALFGITAKECIQRTQYYPSGLPWVEAYSPSEQPWKYNGKEFVEMHGLDEYDSEARWYYPAICRTTTMDPLAEKYYPTSPYAWCGNNTMRFVDPDGMEIHIIGENDSITIYNTNTTYEGADKFTANIYDELNTLDAMLSNTDFMSSLVNSSNVYKISPTNSTTEGTHSYIGQTINIGTDHEIDYLGHELFHAYQDAKGQGGASIYNEVEAYLFQAKILFMNNYGRGSTPLTGEEKSHSPIFNSIINALIYEGYSQSNFNQAIELFKTESNANASGIYNNYPLIRNNQTKSLIKSFYPIYP